MTLVLIGLGITGVLELVLWLSMLERPRRALAPGLVVAIAILTVTLLILQLSVWVVLLGLINLYRCLNLSRLVASRVHPDYLFHVARQTSVWLISFQLLVATIAGFNHYHHFDPSIWLYGLVVAQLLCGTILFASTKRHLRTTSPPEITDSMSDKDLPTLTVAIPARNETTDLEACLQSLVSSTYPKLEIIVLDDCSQNKRTPEIIRDFAQHGVRFIAGTAPQDSWLAKNHAYAQLAAAANGELLLFCGVDSRFQPESLSILTKTMLQKHKTMLSVLPHNSKPISGGLLNWMIQPSRYAWELALPRRLLNRPPVLSTCWLITAQSLHAGGGFEAVRRTGVPESYFARAAANANDGYSFLRSTAAIGVDCQKSIVEQRATAVRTRYLQLHRRPELALLVSLAELAILIGPYAVLLVSLLSQQWYLLVLSSLSVVLGNLTYSRIVNLTYQKSVLTGTWILPLAAIYDIGLLNYSMWQYEFREVIWKGRNICVPIMRVVPKLPDF